MKKWLFPALGCLACALVLAAAAVLPYRAMLAQDAARLPRRIPSLAGRPRAACASRPRKARRPRRCMPACACWAKPM